MSTHLQEDWIKQIKPLLYSQDEVPLLGATPAFPWDQFTDGLKKHFEISNLTLVPKALCWKDQTQVLDGMGDDPQQLHCTFSPIDGSVAWIMSQQDLSQFFTWLLGGAVPAAALPNEELKKGFYTYIGMEILRMIDQVGYIADLSPQIVSLPSLPEGPFLCLDVTIKAQGKTLLGRLCFNNEFRKSWKQAHSDSALQHSSLGPKLELLVGVEIGKMYFSITEWSTVNLGDFILLEDCGYDHESKKGVVNLTINNTPFFQGRLRSDTIKLNEHPLYFKEGSPMEKNNSVENPSKPTPDEEPAPSEEADENFFVEDEELAAVLETELKKKEKKEATQNNNTPQEDAPKENSISSPTDIPLTVSIEIAHLRLTVKQILELSPGNQLSLGKEPDSFVDLMVDGKCIGKGELIRVGELLGVRILQL